MTNPLVLNPNIKIAVVKTKLSWKNPLTIINAIIRLGSPKFDHALMIAKDADQQIYIYQSTGKKGTHVMPLFRYLAENESREVYHVDYNTIKFPKRLKFYLGSDYDFRITWQFTGFILSKRLFGDCKLTRWFSNQHNNNKLFCSEYVGEVIGLDKPYLVTPSDISILGQLTKLTTTQDYYNLWQA